MHPIGQAIEKLFTLHNWGWQKLDEYRYTFSFRTEDNRYDLLAIIGEQRNTLCIYTKMPLQTPRDRLVDVGEFVARANWDMTLGNFELDYRDGEIRFKISANFREHEPEPDDIHDMIDCSLAMAERYCPGLGAILYGGSSAEEAVRNVEIS